MRFLFVLFLCVATVFASQIQINDPPSPKVNTNAPASSANAIEETTLTLKHDSLKDPYPFPYFLHEKTKIMISFSEMLKVSSMGTFKSWHLVDSQKSSAKSTSFLKWLESNEPFLLIEKDDFVMFKTLSKAYEARRSTSRVSQLLLALVVIFVVLLATTAIFFYRVFLKS